MSADQPNADGYNLDEKLAADFDQMTRRMFQLNPENYDAAVKSSERIEQLERELSQEKGAWHTVCDERDQLKSKLLRLEDELNETKKERDEWKACAESLAEINLVYSNLCEELQGAAVVAISTGRYYKRTREALTTFNQLKEKSK